MLSLGTRCDHRKLWPILMNALQSCSCAGLFLLAWNIQAADSRPWQDIRQEVTRRVMSAQGFADELAKKSQQMERRLVELQRQSDEIHLQIGDLERQISKSTPKVEEMNGTLRAQYDQLQSTIRHRDDTQNQLNQERAAVQALYEGYARCVHDASIFAFFCGQHPGEQEAVQARERQMGEWERLIDEDSRNIENLNQQVRNQYEKSLNESFALLAAKAERERVTGEMTATAKETSAIRAGWLCIYPIVQDIRTRIADIEGLVEEEQRPFVRAVLALLEGLEGVIQELQKPTFSELPESCRAA